MFLVSWYLVLGSLVLFAYCVIVILCFLSVFSTVIALFYFMIRYNNFLIYVCVYEQINVFCLLTGCKQILCQ